MDPLQQETRIARLRENIAVNHGDAVRALEDFWLEDAYEAERQNNPAKYNYIMGWVRRVPSLILSGPAAPEKEMAARVQSANR